MYRLQIYVLFLLKVISVCYGSGAGRGVVQDGLGEGLSGLGARWSMFTRSRAVADGASGRGGVRRGAVRV